MNWAKAWKSFVLVSIILTTLYSFYLGVKSIAQMESFNVILFYFGFMMIGVWAIRFITENSDL